MTAFYGFACWLTKVLFWICYNVSYEGREKVPDTGGYLIVANHQFCKDPFLVAHGVRRQIFFMGKKEYFDNFFLGIICRGLGAFAVDRGAGDMGAIGRGVELIREGKLVGLFPEGTRNRTGGPMKAKSGAALIARETGADIIPCALIFDSRRGFRARMTVKYGDVIPYASLGFEDELKPASLRRASKLIVDRINQLRGQEFCDEDFGG